MDAIKLLGQGLPSLALQLLRLCIWLVLLSVIFVPVERLFALHPQKVLRKEVLTDLGFYFLSSFIPGILLGIPLTFIAWITHHLVPPIVTSTVAGWPPALRIAAAFVVGDIGFYWGHRLSHEIPFLWRFHAVHHSAEHLDFLVNTRAHPVDMVFTRLCGLVPLYVLGLAAPMRGSSSLVPLLVLLLGVTWGFFVHANLRWRLGPIEWFVSTPAFHHWHHCNQGEAFNNKNYAPMLPWIDRMFGTLHLPKSQHPSRYGIDEPTSSGFLAQLFEPFAIRTSKGGWWKQLRNPRVFNAAQTERPTTLR